MAKSEKKANSRRVQTGKNNRDWGEAAERIAAEYFLTQGYIIRAQNWKSGRNEVDIILEKDRTLIFVEVKARKPGTQDPIDAVGKAKRVRIIKAADAYMSNETLLYEYRFDIFAIIGNEENYTFEHFPDAYMPTVNAR